MKLFLSAALIAAGAIPAPASEPLSRTRTEILALPPGEVAGILLGNIATRFVTMAADAEDGGTYLRFVRLATAPQRTGFAGLCQARVLQVGLTRPEDGASPATVWSYETYDVYKVISEVDGPLGPLDPTEEEQARPCTGAGPVVVPWSDTVRSARFFGYRGYGEPWMGVAALQGLIREARAGNSRPVECTRRDLNDCRNPRAELGALALRDLRNIEVVQPDPGQPNFQVRASFVVESGAASSLGREVSFDFNGELLPIRRTRPVQFTYSRVRLSRTS